MLSTGQFSPAMVMTSRGPAMVGVSVTVGSGMDNVAVPENPLLSTTLMVWTPAVSVGLVPVNGGPQHDGGHELAGVGHVNPVIPVQGVLMHLQRHAVDGDHVRLISMKLLEPVLKPSPVMVSSSLGRAFGLADAQLGADDGELGVLTPGVHAQGALGPAGNHEGRGAGTVAANVTAAGTADFTIFMARGRPLASFRPVQWALAGKSCAKTVTVSPTLAVLGETRWRAPARSPRRRYRSSGLRRQPCRCSFHHRH